MGSVFVALVLLLALAFCIRKNKREGSVARPSRGSLSVGTNNGRISFFFFLFFSYIAF